LSGYYQSEKYFKHCEEKIRSLFEFRDNIIEESDERLNALKLKYPGKKIIAVHLRLGDYLNLKEHHTCLMDTNYYFNAINICGLDDCVFYVFSNDEAVAENFMNGLKNKLQSLQFEINRAGSPHKDMCAISKCDGVIIANSSFSWWGAWLNRCSDSLKLAPQKERWFGPAYSNMEVNDIIPDSWRQVIC
jgi:hypothetical protein